ncbi:MAG: hypothetical protein CENE_01458 [Candidatus Celerinatantimonas neptuna]|nr:MAG: hypothetical protein CENE_01458 [Candidatus Celerinatantimonas neptuna]
MSTDNLELIGDFLRRKRESLTPEMMGLPKPLRTRTPGLRREDVASLAGISAVWYSKIERGKATGISSQVLSALGDALRLSQSERKYLYQLSTHQKVGMKEPCRHASFEGQQLLHVLNPLPGLLMNDYFDIIMSNQSFNQMCGFDLNALPEEQRNYIYLTITNSRWQHFLQIDDNKTLAHHLTRQAGFLRNVMGARPDDHCLKVLVNRFRSLLPAFAKAWEKNTVQQHPDQMIFTFTHAQLGEMTFKKQNWWNCYNGHSSGRLSIYHTQSEGDYHKMLGVMETDSFSF